MRKMLHDDESNIIVHYVSHLTVDGTNVVTIVPVIEAPAKTGALLKCDDGTDHYAGIDPGWFEEQWEKACDELKDDWFFEEWNDQKKCMEEFFGSVRIERLVPSDLEIVSPAIAADKVDMARRARILEEEAKVYRLLERQRQANDAFKEKKYEKVVELLEKDEAILSEILLRKLRYARKKTD